MYIYIYIYIVYVQQAEAKWQDAKNYENRAPPLNIFRGPAPPHEDEHCSTTDGIQCAVSASNQMRAI